MEELEFAIMKYPWMRQELIDYLEGLADPAYQKKCWVEGICPDGTAHDELDYAIHFLFDDTELGSDPETCIGTILVDTKEAAGIRRLCGAIDEILNRYGANLSDAQYIAVPEWETVINASREALHILRLTDT